VTDPRALTFGLPSCLHIPIAAASIASIREFVGNVIQIMTNRDGRINALAIAPYDRATIKHRGVKLWRHPRSRYFLERLHPSRQVWVHVDYASYREAYVNLGMPPITPGYLLDHVQNREAIRLREYSHPYLRLCPVSRRVNTSGGINTGGEGMEKQLLNRFSTLPQGVRDVAVKAMASQIIYADPMDLTKMLDISPGSVTLPGVRDTQSLFYPL